MSQFLQVDLRPTDLESSVRVKYDVGFLCANFNLPRPLLLIAKTAKSHVYIPRNVDIIPMSSFNVITGVVFHLRYKNDDAFYVQYKCRCILLLSAIYE